MLLSNEETELLLRQVPKIHKTRINDVLLTALAQALRLWTNQDEVLIHLEGHGREELFPANIGQTVGWFTSLFPVKLQLAKNASQRDIELQSIKSQLANIPKNGVGFGILEWLCEDEDIVRQLRELPEPAVGFNYLGQAGFKSKGQSGVVIREEGEGIDRCWNDLRYLIVYSIIHFMSIYISIYPETTLVGLQNTFGGSGTHAGSEPKEASSSDTSGADTATERDIDDNGVVGEDMPLEEKLIAEAR